MKVAICDDDERIHSVLKGILEKVLSWFDMPCSVDLYARGDAFCSFVCRGAYDLIFLDIKMPGENGMEVGEYIRDVLGDEEVQIVFISSNQNYAIRLFEYRPLDFLVKPLTIQQVKKVVDTYRKIRGIGIHCFCCDANQKSFHIQLSEILYFSSELRKVTVHTVDGEGITFYDHLDRIYSELKDERFVYVHKSYLVNYDKIRAASAKQIVLKNGMIIPISQSRRKMVKEELKRLDVETEIIC